MGFFNKKQKENKSYSKQQYYIDNMESVLTSLAGDYNGLLQANPTTMRAEYRDMFLQDVRQYLSSESVNEAGQPLTNSIMRVQDSKGNDFLLVYQPVNDKLIVMQPNNFSQNNRYDYESPNFPQELKAQFESAKVYMRDNLGPMRYDNAVMLLQQDLQYVGKPNYSYAYLDNIHYEVHNSVSKNSELLQSIQSETVYLRQYETTQNYGNINREYELIKSEIGNRLGINLSSNDLNQYKNVDFTKYMETTAELYTNLKTQNNLSMENIDAIFASVDAKVMYGRVRSPQSYEPSSTLVMDTIKNYKIEDIHQVNGDSFRIITAESQAIKLVQDNMLRNEKNANSRSKDCQAFCTTIESIRESMSNDMINRTYSTPDFEKIKVCTVENTAINETSICIMDGNKGNNIHNITINHSPGKINEREVFTLDKKSVDYVDAFKKIEEKSYCPLMNKLVHPFVMSSDDTFVKNSIQVSNEPSNFTKAFYGENVNMSTKEKIEFAQISPLVQSPNSVGIAW